MLAFVAALALLGAGAAAATRLFIPTRSPVKAEDPRPRLSVPGDMGSAHPTAFGWMIPIIRAVGTGELARVNHAILRDGSYGGQFWLWAAVGMGLKESPRYGHSLLTDLDRRAR